MGSVRTSDVPYLNFTSGDTEYNDIACIALPSTMIANCLGTRTGEVPATIDKISYGSGHFQNHTVSVIGIGSLNSGALTSEIASTVGDFGSNYINVSLTDGIEADATGYGAFLRKMLRGCPGHEGLGRAGRGLRRSHVMAPATAVASRGKAKRGRLEGCPNIGRS